MDLSELPDRTQPVDSEAIHDVKHMFRAQGMDLIQLSVTAWLPPGKMPKKTWGDTVTNQRS